LSGDQGEWRRKMSEKMIEAIHLLEQSKVAFKSDLVKDARKILEDILQDPAYSYDALDEIVELIESEMAGKFTLPEVMAIIDCHNSHAFGHSDLRFRGAGMAHNVEDACAMEDLDKKWKINGRALADKLKALTDCQAWWVSHAIQVWWYDQNIEANTDEDTCALFRIKKPVQVTVGV